MCCTSIRPAFVDSVSSVGHHGKKAMAPHVGPRNTASKMCTNQSYPDWSLPWGAPQLSKNVYSSITLMSTIQMCITLMSLSWMSLTQISITQMSLSWMSLSQISITLKFLLRCLFLRCLCSDVSFLDVSVQMSLSQMSLSQMSSIQMSNIYYL